MVNPVLTILFELFLVGSAITVIAAMVQEYFDSRTPAVGGRAQTPPATEYASGQGAHQRRPLRKVA